MTYDKNKTYSQLQNVDFENVMNKNEGNYEELQMALSKYKQALDKMEDFPEDLKNKMYENASKNISDVRYLGDQRHYDFDGMFHCETGLIGVVVKNPIKYNDYILMHEMTHAATYKEDKTNIENSRIGLETFNSSVGAGINEGMTEYFAIEISKKSNYPNFDSYSDLVSIAENMVNLYGKDTMLDAMVNGPEKLEELMAKDGKSFTEFREMVDDYNRQVYNNKELDFTEASKTEDARKMYSNINGYMEEIRSTRLAKESWFQKENTESKKNLMNKNDEEERYGK